jgi:hypothetical protein
VIEQDRACSSPIRGRNVQTDVAQATRSRQGLVQYVRAVRRGHDDDVGNLLNSVELRKQRAQDSVRCATAVIRPTAAADSIQLVKEHQHCDATFRKFPSRAEPRDDPLLTLAQPHRVVAAARNRHEPALASRSARGHMIGRAAGKLCLAVTRWSVE